MLFSVGVGGIMFVKLILYNFPINNLQVGF